MSEETKNMDEEIALDEEKPKRQNMRKVSVRITEDVYDELYELAQANDINFSTVLRMAIGRNMCKYISSSRWVDAEQGAEIRAELRKIMNEMQNATVQLHRMGVNVQQLAKFENMQEKINQQEFEIQKGNMTDEEILEGKRRIKAWEAQRDTCKLNAVKRDEFEKVCSRFELAMKEGSDGLCRILE